MRFLANENFPAASVRRLRQAGHDVAAVSEDNAGASDDQVLTRAVQEERIIVTFDRDYGELIYRRKLPASPAGSVRHGGGGSLTCPGFRAMAAPTE